MSDEEELPPEALEVLNGCKLEDMAMRVVYENYKGEESIRHVLPLRTWYGSTEYHPEKQWFIKVYDLDKKAIRDYTLNDWKGAPKD